jgi:16S rRNA (guanine527-N7)-methyltransferase
MSSVSIFESLHLGVLALKLDLDDIQEKQLCDFLSLLNKWNQAFNLSGIKEIKDMVPVHILDSLSVLPHLEANKVLDVGTGAGLPGIPLAIANPETSFTLLDSSTKKTNFLHQCALELDIKNVKVKKKRAQDYKCEILFDVAISRAYNTLVQMGQDIKKLLAPEGRIFAMKGKYPKEEIEEAEKLFNIIDIKKLNVPQLNAERHLIIMAPNNEIDI